MGKRIVYHYHENAFAKGTFYKLLAKAMQKLANEIICVSAYQASFLQRKECVTVVPNALPQDFISRLVFSPETAFKRKQVLMLGSLKLYKSPLEFCKLAENLPQYFFDLVVNDTQENIDLFIETYKLHISKNLLIYPQQNDVAPFYNRASLVLNLSNKEKVVETFGLTALEAMSVGLPVIVPTEGGIAEMVENGVNGYKIDVTQLAKIEQTIESILEDKNLYIRLSNNALACSKHYDINLMISNIILCIEAL